MVQNAISLEYSYGGRRLLEGTTGTDANGNSVLQTVEGGILDGTCYGLNCVPPHSGTDSSSLPSEGTATINPLISNF